jgi:hypothetical protein
VSEERRRPSRPDDEGTTEITVPLILVDRKIDDAITKLRGELAADVDRRAIEAVAQAAREAKAHSEHAADRSHRRWMKVIAAAAILFALGAALFAFASENRARIEHLERLIEPTHRRTP